MGSAEIENNAAEVPMTWELPAGTVWIKGAKAMASFQSEHYATGQSGKNQHHDSKAMTLVDVTRVCQNGAQFGLSHCFTFRAVNQSYAVARVTVFHESGESIFSEIGFSTDFKGARSREQALGSAKTYYHKYMLSGLYGLANDDDDDGEAAVRTTPAQVQTPKPLPVAPLPKPVVPYVNTVPVPKAEITTAQTNNALRILKQEDGKAKTAFLAKFYPSKSKLIASDINTLEHAVFLDDFELNARLVH